MTLWLSIALAAKVSVALAPERVCLDLRAGYFNVASDPNGRLTNWNWGGEKSLGRAASGAIGRHASVFVTPAVSAAGSGEIEIALAKAEGFASDQHWQRDQRFQFWFTGEFQPIWRQHNEIFAEW